MKDIAKRQGISQHYLEHLFIRLSAAGLVNSTRGAKGGFALAKPPIQIKISNVVQLLEGSLAPVQCVDNPKMCSRAASCVTRDVWADMKTAMNKVLESSTLQDLVERHSEKERARAIMYHI
ncbi:RrF2 family transcriptional regulator [Chloroflexota bacterium]